MARNIAFLVLLSQCATGQGEVHDDVGMLQVVQTEYAKATIQQIRTDIEGIKSFFPLKQERFFWKSNTSHSNMPVWQSFEKLSERAWERGRFLVDKMKTYRHGFSEEDRRALKDDMLDIHSLIKGGGKLNASSGHRKRENKRWAAITSIAVLAADFVGELSTTWSCGALDWVLWLTMGYIELMIGEDHSFANATNVLAQQLSTVGYGSNVPEGLIFQSAHGMSAVFATLILDPWWNMLKETFVCMIGLHQGKTCFDMGKSTQTFEMPKFDQSLVPLASLVLTEVVLGLLYWWDFNTADPDYDKMLNLHHSLYMIAMTMTTVGYGDYSPQTAAGKALSWLAMLTSNGIFDWAKSEIAAKAVDPSTGKLTFCKSMGH